MNNDLLSIYRYKPSNPNLDENNIINENTYDISNMKPDLHENYVWSKISKNEAMDLFPEIVSENSEIYDKIKNYNDIDLRALIDSIKSFSSKKKELATEDEFIQHLMENIEKIIIFAGFMKSEKGLAQFLDDISFNDEIYCYIFDISRLNNVVQENELVRKEVLEDIVEQDLLVSQDMGKEIIEENSSDIEEVNENEEEDKFESSEESLKIDDLVKPGFSLETEPHYIITQFNNDINKYISSLVKEIEEFRELFNITNNKIEIIQESTEQIGEKINETNHLKEDISKINSSIDLILEKITDKKIDENIEEELNSVKQQLEDVNNKRDKLSSDYDRLHSINRENEQLISKLQTEITLLKDELSSISSIELPSSTDYSTQEVNASNEAILSALQLDIENDGENNIDFGPEEDLNLDDYKATEDILGEYFK